MHQRGTTKHDGHSKTARSKGYSAVRGIAPKGELTEQKVQTVKPGVATNRRIVPDGAAAGHVASFDAAAAEDILKETDLGVLFPGGGITSAWTLGGENGPKYDR